MPGDSGRVGEAGDLVDDDAAARRVGLGGAPGRAQQRVERARRAALDREGQLGQQFAFPGLGRDHPGAGHHVVRGDPLEQGAFQPLLARHDEVRGVPGERAGAGGEGGVLGGDAEAADQLAGHVLQRGGALRAALVGGGPDVQGEQRVEDLGEFGHRDVFADIHGGRGL